MNERRAMLKDLTTKNTEGTKTYFNFQNTFVIFVPVLVFVPSAAGSFSINPSI